MRKSVVNKKEVLLTFLLVLLDVVIIIAAFYISQMIRFDGIIPEPQIDLIPLYFILIFPVYFIILVAVVRLYKIVWAHAGVQDAIKVAIGVAIADGITLLFDQALIRQTSFGTLLLVGIFVAAFIVISRFLIKLIIRNKKDDTKHKSPRVLIVGAGDGGHYCARMMKQKVINGTPVVFVDDDREKQRKFLDGVLVAGTTEDIPYLVEKYDIDRILVSINASSNEEKARILNICNKTKCVTRIMALDDAKDPQEAFSVKDIDITDLLPRSEIKLDDERIRRLIKDSVILVTGGGGSIGSEICRQMVRYSPERIVVFDIYENNAYDLQCELVEKYGNTVPVSVRIGSIREYDRLDAVIKEFNPSIVVNAAAHKHVPLMEDNPFEAIKNNVLGTRNVMQCASNNNVKRFVQISTDKAVNPPNIMGATKRVTELMLKEFSKHTEMKCMAVRFGNVLGSNGSVIPLMVRQIKHGGPVTVTHKDIVRFFMTIPEAAQLVLQTMTFDNSGDIFVFDMGKPVKIYDVAVKLIEMFKLEPEKDIKIKIIGLRPGEKLYEELVMAEEDAELLGTSNSKILQIEQNLNINNLDDKINSMIEYAKNNNEDAINILMELVPSLAESKRASVES